MVTRVEVLENEKSCANACLQLVVSSCFEFSQAFTSVALPLWKLGQHRKFLLQNKCSKKYSVSVELW